MIIETFCSTARQPDHLLFVLLLMIGSDRLITIFHSIFDGGHRKKRMVNIAH